MKPKFELSAGGIIQNSKGEILMILDQFGNWTFPKGHIDKDETPEQAAVREVKEEVGLDARIVKKLLVDDYWFIAAWEPGKPRVHKKVYWFLMRAEGTPAAQADEIKEATWVARSAIDSLKTYKNTATLLQHLT